MLACCVLGQAFNAMHPPLCGKPMTLFSVGKRVGGRKASDRKINSM